MMLAGAAAIFVLTATTAGQRNFQGDLYAALALAQQASFAATTGSIGILEDMAKCRTVSRARR